MDLVSLLEPIAAWFRSLGIPEPIVHWGHPVMMGIVIFVMGSYTAYAGWRSRIAEPDVAVKSRTDHRKLAPWMFLFLASGYTGGILSLVTQQQPILQSPHFLTGTIALGFLGFNGIITITRFGDKDTVWRTIHAYVGTVAMGLLVVHAALGLNLGLSL
ncbi:DUF4079 domain-containing protein [Calothrix sp. NIES-3974]|uniref:DUF4079 domain-containing protein n=1 Tax=Calothrix sp. NIES-3974 TaxID=2005462 RepID=UPI000B5DBECB|nr:DUF4079 domain-containing protein [Calothrix sp. NIES-3974]BAZ04336.1 hypothetical protein NIES3974_09730 [Calothrix sp. NIES-3974]